MKLFLMTVLLSLTLLVGCSHRTTPTLNHNVGYFYTNNDNLYSNRVDYLGYGLGGKGLGGYSMGGYGIAGYAGAFPDS